MTADGLLRVVTRTYRPDVAGITAELHRHGWAEANAGNFSIRLADPPRFTGRIINLPGHFAGLARQVILMKRAGARMRDIARRPESGVCLLKIGPDGTKGQILPPDAIPTSELPSHLASHELLIRQRPEQNALLHTHPTELIALTDAVRSPARLLELLAGAHAESQTVMRRTGIVGRFNPGTTRLAQATARALLQHDVVIWPGHGVIAAGHDLRSALDLIEILNKLATIALLRLRI
ncbi:MAG: class II aldolase/adducin family protein [candidate division WOR-3 bacterium]